MKNNKKPILLCLAILVMLSFSISYADASEFPQLEMTSNSRVLDNAIIHPYLSDPLFRDNSGKLHAGLSHYSPYDGYYLSSTDNGATWPVNINITQEYTASKGGSIYINQNTGKGLYLGFFNVSGTNLNYTSDYGATWTRGSYNFIPGATNGLTGYIYPMGSVYDGLNTVYALNWGSWYHWGNGKLGISKSTDLGRTWTSLSGAPNSNSMVLDSSDTYAIDSTDMVINKNGNLYVLYMAKDTSGIWNLKAYNTSTGNHEVVRANLGYNRFGTTALTSWVDNDGETIHAAYVIETGPTEKSTIYHAVRNVDGSWTSQEIGSDGINMRPASASSTIDPDGNTYLVWCTYDGTKSTMFYSVCPSSTRVWSPVTSLFEESSYSFSNPYIKALDTGKVEMLWTKSNTSSRSVQYGQFELTCLDPEDSTPPEITPVINGVLGENGWYVSDVSVSWSVQDNESDIIRITGGETTVITEDVADLILTCQAESSGGTSSKSITINIDKTAPVVSISSPLPGEEYIIGEGIDFQWSCEDALSGIISENATEIDLSVPGQKVFTVTASDTAGNISSASVNFQILSINEAIDRLIQKVRSLNLHKGTEISLLAKLDAAKASYMRYKYSTCINQLNAFINEASAQSDKKIRPAESADITLKANRIISALSKINQ